MSIEVKPGDHYLGIWFVPAPPKGEGDQVDWMACAYREPSGEYVLKYRFRYYAEGPDQDPWNGKDRKSWYEGRMPAGTDEGTIISAVRKVGREVAKMLGTSLDFAHVNGGPEEFVQAIQTRSWAHTKEMSAEEAKERGLIGKG